MKFAYFDCFSGASGDMILGALMDSGLPLDTLQAEIAKLHLSHYKLGVERVSKRGLRGSQAKVSIDQGHHQHQHRNLRHIEKIITSSDLDQTVKQKSITIFTRLAEAEANVHGRPVDQVHFHEVGAMDAIIDVVGAVAGFNALGIEKIFCSPLHVGTGTVECAHGTLPVPAPATAELIKGKPIYSTGVQGELLTPTGAAILTTLCNDFGPMPAMIVEKIGYGAGTSDPVVPNLLRISIGSAADDFGACETDQVVVLETNIDDMSPQLYDHVIQQVLDRGALDIYLTPVQMKKNRPGIVLTLICAPGQISEFAELLLAETTTIGMRWRVEKRLKAQRTVKKIDTPYGPIRVKFAVLDGKIVNVSPEYEDCKRIAVENKVPLKNVIDGARAAISEK